MRIRDWEDIMQEVVEADAPASDWRAIAGDRADGIGEDMFLGHPDVGVYGLKTYAKNPFEVQGVGTKVARRVDADLDPLLPGDDAGGRFGVNTPIEDESAAETTAKRLEAVIETHADAPTTGDALFEDVMDALDSPAFGPMEYDSHGRPDDLGTLSETFEEATSLLDSELDDLIDAENVDRGFH
ncbi:MAG: hypothetical protein PPP58_11710 [Natronomonas sp.]